MVDCGLTEPMDLLDCWDEELYHADRGLFTEAGRVIARLTKGQADADQEEKIVAIGDKVEGVRDDDDAGAQDGSHEGRGARVEQAFSHTAVQAVAGVVHTGHLFTTYHATLEEDSSEMVGVETNDLREQMPVLLPEQASTDLAIASIGGVQEIVQYDNATLEEDFREVVVVGMQNDNTTLEEDFREVVVVGSNDLMEQANTDLAIASIGAVKEIKEEEREPKIEDKTRGRLKQRSLFECGFVLDGARHGFSAVENTCLLDDRKEVKQPRSAWGA